MSDTPFVVSTRFRKVVQTAPYESEEAEVSSQFAVPENANAPDAISSALSMVKREVYIALGKAEGKLAAVSTAPKAPDKLENAGTETAKRGPGRPPKITKPVREANDIATEIAGGTDGPSASGDDATGADDFDFTDKPEPKADISDSELQGACSDAAKVIGAPKVKDLFQKKYGAARVSAVLKTERANFLVDLKSLVEEQKKQSE